MYELCDAHGIAYERCGKLIVARDESELARAGRARAPRARERRARACAACRATELREVEPHCAGVAALHSPVTGIVDFGEVARALAADLAGRACAIVTGCGVERRRRRAAAALALRHARGETRAALRRLLRRRWVGPAGGRGRRPPTRASCPSAALPAAAARAPRPGARADLPGARPVAAVPGRAPDPAHRRRGVARPHRAARRRTPALGAHARAGPAPGGWRARWWRTGLTEMRHAASARAGRARPRDYVPGLERRATSSPTSPACAPRRWPATAAWSTTSCSRRPSARCTCATRPRRRPRRRWRSPRLIADRAEPGLE